MRSGGVRTMARCDEARRLRDEANAAGVKAIFVAGGAADEPTPETGERLAVDDEAAGEVIRAVAETN